MKTNVAVVIPNWNGADFISSCLESLKQQSLAVAIVVVDNGSEDGSVKIIKDKFPDVTLVELDKNHGFAGGVNAGIRSAMDNGADYILLLNNDARAEPVWAKMLVRSLENNARLGIVTSKMLSDQEPPVIDSTGEMYSNWGLAFPRGRGESSLSAYDGERVIFGGSGGASGYRAAMLRETGLFDEDFFAYYEDVDLSFRARLAGWDVAYEPSAVVHHHIGGTSKKYRGFTTYHTFKNLPLLIVKNMPAKLLWTVMPRFLFAYFVLFLAKIVKLDFWPAMKGMFMALALTPKKIGERSDNFSKKGAGGAEISHILYKGVPPSYSYLYKLTHPFKKV